MEGFVKNGILYIGGSDGEYSYHVYSDGKLICTTRHKAIPLCAILTSGAHTVEVKRFSPCGEENIACARTRVTVDNK